MKTGILLIGGAAAAALVPISPSLVDRIYSNAAFPVIQPVVTSLSNRVSFALFDLLVFGVLLVWLLAAVRDFLRRRKRGVLPTVARVLWRTAVWGSALYLAFLALWGLNYRRTPLINRLPFDSTAVTTAAAERLAATSVEALNRLYQPAHTAGWAEADHIDDVLGASLARVDRQLGGEGRFVPGRPKRTLFDGYFRRAAVDGMTNPYFLETLIASNVLPFERSFVIAHEWSHLTGIADEGDANFVGWLACVQADPPQQYSGWLFLFSELNAAIAPTSHQSVLAGLAAGPRQDLAAIRERFVRDVSPRVSAAGWRVYDEYLKANRVPAGSASYAQVVRLVLGTRFSPDWHLEAAVTR